MNTQPAIGISGGAIRYALLALLALFAVVPGIAEMPPLDRDESRYVQATRQMVQTGDYVDIRMQEARRYNKPVGIYWMQAAAIALSGKGDAAGIWIYRLVSVLGAVMSVLAVCWTGTRIFGRDAGFVAGLVMAGLFCVAFEGRIAKTDAMLLAFAVLSQGALAQIYLAARRQQVAPGHLPWIFWIAQGFGILIKGPIVPLVSVLTILAVSLFDREWRWLAKLRTGWGLLVVALIVLPWLALISWKSGGAFWQESVGKDLLGKVAQGQESHWGPPGYYILTYSLYVWPFALLALVAGLRALNGMRRDPRLLFCVAWYVPFWLVFEVISTKLPHYMLPAYPALALVIGWWATSRPEGSEQPFLLWQKLLVWLTAFGQVIVTLGLGGLAIAAPIYLGAGISIWGIVAAVFVGLAGYLAFSLGRPVSAGRIGAATVTAAAAYAIMFTAVLPSLSTIWLSPRIAAEVRKNSPCGNSVVASVGYHEPSMVFLTSTETVLTNLSGAAQHLIGDPACALALVPADQGGDLEAKVLKAGKVTERVATIEGLNYSSGDRMTLVLYRILP